MKLLDRNIAIEYVHSYIRERDTQKVPTHSIDFVESIISVIVNKPRSAKDKKQNKPNSIKVEVEINEICDIYNRKINRTKIE